MAAVRTCLILMVAAGAALLPALPAQAQNFPGFAAASADEARRQVDEAIARQGHDQVWENVSTDRTPVIRHRQSGASCRFWRSKVFLNVSPDHMSANRRVQPGEFVWCATWIDLRGDDRLSFETRIVAAPLALDGTAYAFWEPGIADRVTPAYLAWRSAYWAETRQTPTVHEPLRSVRAPDGTSLPVHSVTVHTYGGHMSRNLAVMVNGWIVTQKLFAPARFDEAATQLAMEQLQFTVASMDRAHPQAQAQHELTQAQLAAEAREPAGAGNPLIRRIYDVFVTACVQPLRGGRSFDTAREARGWQRVPAPEWLPGTSDAPGREAWQVSGEAGGIYVHYDAATSGDCAVSVRDAAGTDGVEGLQYLLTRAADAPFARGAYPRAEGGVVNLTLDGRGWAGEGAMVAPTTGNGTRAGVFIGARRHRQR